MNEEISKLASAFGIKPVTLAAAPLIAEALDRIWEDPSLGPFVAMHIKVTFMDAAFDLRVSTEVTNTLREATFGYFIDEFEKAGWGFGSQLDPETRRIRLAMDFRIPQSLTRTGDTPR